MLTYYLIIALYAILALFMMVVGMLRSRMLYWRRRGVPHDEPAFIIGNLKGFTITRQLTEVLRETYNKYKGSEGPFCGFYLLVKPIALVTDLDLARNVLIRDFHKFDDRGLFHNKRDDALSENLWNLEPPEWRALRKKLTPIFAAGNIQLIFPLVANVGEQLTRTFSELQNVDAEQDMYELFQRYTTDAIAICIFGVECNSLSCPDAEFRAITTHLLTKSRHNNFVKALIQCLPRLAQRWRMGLTPNEVRDFYFSLVGKTILQREDQKIKRTDLMNALIELQNAELEEDKLSITEIVANSAFFFSASYGTTSATMTFALYELAANQQVQTKLRNEILEVLAKHGNKVTFASLAEMSYLDMVIAETLRKYPIYPYLERVANDDYETGTPGFIIYSGTKVLIPVEAIQHDPEIYPEPAKFIPERFDTEELRQRHPIAWLPFGEGPRNCVGMRLGQLLIRLGLVSMLRKHKFASCSRTPSPMAYEEASLLLKPKGSLYLRADKL